MKIDEVKLLIVREGLTEALMAELLRSLRRVPGLWLKAQHCFLLGEEMTVLDLYVAVASRWTPRRRRFYVEAPRMAEVVRRVDALPQLQTLWAERLPFAAGWEG